MRRILKIAVTLVCLIMMIALGMGCNKPSKKPVPAYSGFPGEFERQQAIWLMWPSRIYDDGEQPVSPVITNIIKSLARYERVNLMVQGQGTTARVKYLLKTAGYSGQNVHYYVIDHLSIWTRDVGPIFVRGGQHGLKVVNFGFNNYSRDGSPYYINLEGQIDQRAAQLLKLPIVQTKLISEGGAIESNGRGTMMVTESVALRRNAGMSKQEIEREYKRVLRIKKVIWLKKGLAEDDNITSGHINEIARFANPNTILLAQVLPGDRYANQYAQESYLRLEENYRVLRKATDQDGKPFRIIRIPMPPTVYARPGATGDIPVRSYINYALVNGAVLMQTYWQPGRSEQLKATEEKIMLEFHKIFPRRKVTGIFAENINLWGGGFHCITQHMPAE